MQSKDKNDSVQLSSRYQQYMFAKLYFRARSSSEVFPIGEYCKKDIRKDAVSKIHSVVKETEKLSDALRIRNIRGLSATLKGLGGGLGAKTGLYHIDKLKVRRLTPLEAERLMSWPDDWTKYGIDDKGNKVEMSDSQRYKMAGNGVISNVVKEIIKNLTTIVYCGVAIVQ